ncbi:hypothetical protein [Burkholderia phage BCSR5]|nr:hypothetical protein [Burkholderia phage BCSR5]
MSTSRISFINKMLISLCSHHRIQVVRATNPEQHATVFDLKSKSITLGFQADPQVGILRFAYMVGLFVFEEDHSTRIEQECYAWEWAIDFIRTCDPKLKFSRLSIAWAVRHLKQSAGEQVPQEYIDYFDLLRE